MKRFSLFLLFASTLSAAPYAYRFTPWYGPDKLLEYSFESSYSHFDGYKSKSDKIVNSQDVLEERFELKASPASEFNILIDGSLANRFYKSTSLMAGYTFLNDLEGDFITASTGLSIQRNTHIAAKNRTLLLHGRMEYLAYLTLGKELIHAESRFSLRAFKTFGFGISHQGSPWLESSVVIEKSLTCYHLLALFAEGSFGLGSKRLEPHFINYSPIQHRNIDLGASFSTSYFSFGKLSLTVSGRIVAYNAPCHGWQGALMLTRPYAF